MDAGIHHQRLARVIAQGFGEAFEGVAKGNQIQIQTHNTSLRRHSTVERHPVTQDGLIQRALGRLLIESHTIDREQGIGLIDDRQHLLPLRLAGIGALDGQIDIGTLTVVATGP